jgi:hypothetical protein
MYYMAPGILLYLIDRIIRVARYTTPTGPFNMRAIADADLTEIELLEPSFDFKPGQYCFLCIPELSELEWHPFSISSTPAFETIYNQVVLDHQEEKENQPRKRRGGREKEQEGENRKKGGRKVEDDESLLPPTPVSFHIRGLSSESWSRQLFFMVYGQYGDGIAPEGALLVNAAGKIIGPSISSSSASINADLRRTKRLSSRGKEGQKTFRVLVDGPYGNTFEECKAYQNLIFICGGIGITSMIGILEALAIENQHIRDLELAEDVNYFDLVVEDEKRQKSEGEEETEDKEVEKQALLRNEKVMC